MAGGSETRAGRDADGERILGERERDASDHARPIRQWRAGAHVSIRISSIRPDQALTRQRLGYASLARDLPETPTRVHETRPSGAPARASPARARLPSHHDVVQWALYNVSAWIGRLRLAWGCY
jgi:hypothetical protein